MSYQQELGSHLGCRCKSEVPMIRHYWWKLPSHRLEHPLGCWQERIPYPRSLIMSRVHLNRQQQCQKLWFYWILQFGQCSRFRWVDLHFSPKVRSGQGFCLWYEYGSDSIQILAIIKNQSTKALYLRQCIGKLDGDSSAESWKGDVKMQYLDLRTNSAGSKKTNTWLTSTRAWNNH